MGTCLAEDSLLQLSQVLSEGRLLGDYSDVCELDSWYYPGLVFVRTTVPMLANRCAKKYCNRLNGVVFEGLQLPKSAYRNGHISAASDAKQHIDALIASFDDEEVDDEDLPELIDA